MDAGLKKARKPNPRENAFPLSAATFWYTLPTFIQGFRRDLEESDLTETLTEHQSSILGNKMEKYWKLEEERAARVKKTPSLHRVLFKVFGVEFMLYGLVLAISEAIRIVQPIFLGQLLNYYTPGQATISQNEAYLYAGGVVLCSLINILTSHPYMMGVLHMGMKVRVACCSLIYRKALKLSKTALGETTAGQVVNLLSNDVNRFDVAVIFAHNLWVGPLETVVCTYLMYLEVGVSAVIGVLLLIMFIPMQIYLGKKISVFRLRTALRTDERVRLMNEIISGIQVIKMYAWEKPFAHLVALARRFEIKSIRITSYMRGVILSFIMYSTRMSIFATILAYVLLENDITAKKVFVLTSFYNILRQTMTVFFPNGISQVAEANVSINRLNKFLVYDETEIAKGIRRAEIALKANGIKKVNGDLKTSSEEESSAESKGIFMTNATAKWTEASTDNTFTNITLQATPGKLLAIIGPVGSGKTSLLHSMLQELPLSSGSLKINGEISYASQEPWLFAGSVRQNILFGLPMDKDRYKTVVKKCALQRDFSLLPYGDKTIVGDRGVSLSGGQRARINLARAVYKQADIYLLDDPLSAVDTHVGKQLFDDCINGYLRNKTVILITHQLQYLKDAANIVLIDDGIQKASGTYKDLQASGLDFTNLLGEHTEEDKEESELIRQGSIRSVASCEIEEPKEVEEQKSSGSVGAYVYRAYFKAGGNCCAILTLFSLFIIAQLFGSAADYFITYWVNIEQEDASEKRKQDLSSKNNSLSANNGSIYSLLLTASNNDTSTDFWHFSRETSIYIYSVIIALLVTTALIRSFTFFSICMRASTNLHDNMFSSITRATMRFFNTNNAGRILNRFSKDMGSIDELLPAAMIDCLQIGLALLGIIIVVAIVNPWLMIPTCLIGVIFYLLRIFYLRTSRNVKRLEGVTRSPVFSHLNASLNGLTTIRAFGAQEILIKEFDNHQDLHSSAWFSFISTSRAFGYWLDLVCIIYITLVTFSFLLIGNEKFGGNVGLAITQAIGLTGMFQWGMRQSTELENQMTSVERVVEYSDIEHEGALETPKDDKPPETWPDQGKIEFKNVFLRYFPNDPPVLRNLSYTILPKEKVGIVGRTGAGKSSLINALFQLSDTDGQIIIDGYDITKLGLHDLRSKISIIPQEPVLFSGTMRKNLDPFDDYTDADLWRALEDVELKEAVADLTSGLNSKMSEGGSNFSVGQRQLVCLARAILRNNKILVLDEATANVDPQTDALIQTTIRQKFKDCTVLTIAHRLNTVMDSDKVLVMDAGTLKEFDHPHVLLQNTNGILYGMVQQTGKGMTETLTKIAEESYRKMQLEKM
ncbi:probable multidrug resistance-associated protein lethal(2)03659 isoform X1 [Aethina tumida]|uniref:probable multidrug resistance-associated protein lethal(2)03659 isoform X1 n=1 Tax=Aethina tumida TaxID=116153 RepID=UPI0021496DFC|nr:probable multidrug resistance-associated protein lethal(2)03659 isoform X1 [Aethina tumida]